MSSLLSSTQNGPFKKASKKIKYDIDPRHFQIQNIQKYQVKCHNLPIFEKKKPKYRSIFDHGASYLILGNVLLIKGVKSTDETLISSQMI